LKNKIIFNNFFKNLENENGELEDSKAGEGEGERRNGEGIIGGDSSNKLFFSSKEIESACSTTILVVSIFLYEGGGRGDCVEL